MDSGDDQVDRDDRRLQRDGQPEQEQVRLNRINRLSPRTIAYEARKLNSTIGMTVPTVTITELRK